MSSYSRQINEKIFFVFVDHKVVFVPINQSEKKSNYFYKKILFRNFLHFFYQKYII